MLLTIDAGNTNIVFALFDGDAIVEQWRISTRDDRTADEYWVWLHQLLSLKGYSQKQISGVIIASVVPQVVWPLTCLCDCHLGISPLLIGNGSVDPGIEIDVDNPQEVGADRLVNAVAAAKLFGGPLAIIDFGTATTFDIVDNNGAYAGGVICPGINLSLAALHQAAAKLPRIAIKSPADDRVTGKNTLDAMQSGVFWGYLGMIEGLAERLKREHGTNMKFIATGGLATIFAKHTDVFDTVAKDLTLQGLKIIYEHNV